jgi:hypothetical protein
LLSRACTPASLKMSASLSPGSVGNTVRHKPGGPSAETLKQLHQAPGSAK